MRDGEDTTEAAARAEKPAADDAASATASRDAETVAAAAADADGDTATGPQTVPAPDDASKPVTTDEPETRAEPETTDKPETTAVPGGDPAPAGDATAAVSVGAAMVRLRSAAMDAGRVVWRQSRRPVGRLTTTGVTIVMLVAAAGASGALLIPALVGAKAAPAPSPSVSGAPAPESAPPSPTVEPAPTAIASPSPVARPAAAFHRWAEATSPKVSVPVTALEAYAYAEWVVTSTRPSCKLRWTTLAAIGKIESDHGRTKGAKLGDDAKALPPIVGPALDGTKNTKKINDTDAGRLDFDKKWDHAVGPMQFIPATWTTYGVDADNDQLIDPHDLDDSALAAAYYLCAPNKDLTVVANWKSVVLSYNNVGVYLQKVYDTAQAYGRSSQA
ncbi:lytic murein transglycosylase [Catellatospora vulcania]|uniref:lytic murein transglycosylase n=1 Tax=Catellatospora vulcania TaxID=1460450 RepID=UPI0012D4B56D|nr:lytic murein transglycosylase [Catellatospora vulcania]